MEGPFPNVMNQPDRNELGNPPMVIQQYARFPPTLEPGLHSASSLGSAPSRLPSSKSPPLHRKETPRSLQASPTGVRSGIPPLPLPPPPPPPPPPQASAAQPGPSMSPPMFDPLRQRQPRESMDQPDSRSLPSRDIKDDTIDDAYVMFIFYCNPNVPLSVDTSELRKTFRSPPRSDGKSFSIFTLWELIRKLDNKELKTWISLATELGVEPPVMEKGQSTQKVQQYAVRLKRWMRAMHVDAFFEYCLGHPHPYYNQIPTNTAVVSDSRDGVPLEEDLALRALVPQWKPKRGRKRAEERDITFERLAKRPSLDTSVGILHAGPFPGHSATFPPSAIPFSAFVDEIETNDAWMATPSTFQTGGPPDSSAAHHGHDPRWKPIERDASPASYPHSAIIPRHHHPSEIYISSTEPRSAVTPSSGDRPRPKRRHGPAVSSAWPNNNGSSTGKTRGRPPNRGTVSGPFSSFPVNPNRSDPSQIHQPTSRPSPAILLDHDPSHRFSQSQYQQSPTPFPGPRPNKLQLQVPHHSGAPVRLATPPTLMLNGISNPSGPLKVEGSQRNEASGPAHEMHSAIAPHPQIPVVRNGNSNADIVSDDVVRVLAGELLRAKVTGRPAPLGVEEARNLAVSVVSTLTTSYSQTPLVSPVVMTVLHLGLGPHFGYPGIMESTMIVHVELAPVVPGPDGAPPSFVYSLSHEYKHGLRFTTKVTYGDMTIGKSDGNKRESISRVTDDLDNSIADLDSLTDAEFEVDGADSNASEMTWKQRYMKIRAQLQKKERALSLYKRKILESVMADI